MVYVTIYASGSAKNRPSGQERVLGIKLELVGQRLRSIKEEYGSLSQWLKVHIIFMRYAWRAVLLHMNHGSLISFS